MSKHLCWIAHQYALVISYTWCVVDIVRSYTPWLLTEHVPLRALRDARLNDIPAKVSFYGGIQKRLHGQGKQAAAGFQIVVNSE